MSLVLVVRISQAAYIKYGAYYNTYKFIQSATALDTHNMNYISVPRVGVQGLK